MSKLRTAILTVYTDNYMPLADVVIPVLQQYCVKNDYDLYTYNITGTEVYYGYKKIEKLVSLLESNEVDLILCIDLDVLITNHSIKIESFIDNNHDFYITEDVNGLNAGSFIVRNTFWSIIFLKLILGQQAEFECEQNAIEHLIKPQHPIKILSHPSINSYIYDEYGPTFGIISDRKIEKPTHEEGNWEKGDFILHLPGIPIERRIEIFESLEKEIIL
jgi:hypothetical protein